MLDAVSPGDVVIIDGRSGAGKSTLARELQRRWIGARTPQLVALDELYPGWDGLAAGAEYAVARVLAPRRTGATARWQQWDWETDRYGTERVVAADETIVLEGSGALTSAAAGFATVRIWLDAPSEVRRRRALTRDGETYRPHWERWAAQELDHIARNDPRGLATHVVELV
ncbi:AAA family ATPase [Microbacterium sp. 2P06AB]|uniref:AAA family ATPase n=1 Tax=Microbacterium sp. 2P06AB TaxID=3132291 RepID=UPI0039A6DC33